MNKEVTAARQQLLRDNVVANELTAERLGAFAGVDEGLALAWLGVLHRAGLMTTEYRWYCPKTDKLLRATKSLEETPVVIDCCHCLTAHGRDNECFVELVFFPKGG